LKKFFIIMLSIALLSFSSCSSEKITEINGVKLRGEITIDKVEFLNIPENNFVLPGELIEIKAKITYIDSEGTTASKTVDTIETKVITGEDLISILDGSIRISEEALSGQNIAIDAGLTEEDFQTSLNLTVRKNPADFITADGVITDFNDIDSLVNKERALPRDYVPIDLVKLTVPTVLANPEINQLRKAASDALEYLFQAAEEEDFSLSARSGYRSYATQNSLYSSNVERRGLEHAQKFSAQPGHSEHQTGLAIDITSNSVNNQLTEYFGETPEGIWVSENAHLFGFIIRYPYGKDSITGYSYEPWHLRYVGKDLAGNIFESGLTMEEWFE